jgi:hypothetical protein
LFLAVRRAESGLPGSYPADLAFERFCRLATQFHPRLPVFFPAALKCLRLISSCSTERKRREAFILFWPVALTLQTPLPSTNHNPWSWLRREVTTVQLSVKNPPPDFTVQSLQWRIFVIVR